MPLPTQASLRGEDVRVMKVKAPHFVCSVAFGSTVSSTAQWHKLHIEESLKTGLNEFVLGPRFTPVFLRPAFPGGTRHSLKSGSQPEVRYGRDYPSQQSSPVTETARRSITLWK